MNINLKWNGCITNVEQLRLLGFSEEKINRLLYSDAIWQDLLITASREYIENFVGSASSDVKTSDFEGIERIFEDKEKEEKKGYDK